MCDSLKELKTLKIISKNDITKLRQYIQNKYPQYNDRKRALLLITTIQNIIDQYLGDFSLNYRQPIRDRIIQHNLVENKDGIFLFDILQASLALDTLDDFLIDELCSWANKHIEAPISRDIILSYKRGDFPASDNKNDNNDKSEPDLDEVLDKPLHIDEKPTQHKKEEPSKDYPASKDPKLTYIIGFTLILFLVSGIFMRTTKGAQPQEQAPAQEIEPVILEYKYSHLPENFYYKKIDEEKLKEYLNSRESLLEKEPYFSEIINVAREFELNPLVLFAIAGHEQGFVPKDHPASTEIANNPFNVFHSWQDYNTNITDSSEIAARTVINLSKDRPEDVDPFQWINRKYAEDENWWVGVRSIYNKLEEETQ